MSKGLHPATEALLASGLSLPCEIHRRSLRPFSPEVGLPRMPAAVVRASAQAAAIIAVERSRRARS